MDEALTQAVAPVQPSSEPAPALRRQNSAVLVARQTSPILRQLSGAVGLGPSFYCQICMGNNNSADGYALSCGHVFCQDCLADYARGACGRGAGAPRADGPGLRAH